MSGRERTSPFSDSVLDEAGMWLGRMDNAPEEYRCDFDAWCRAAPDHRPAYDWVKAREEEGRSAALSARVQSRIDELDNLPQRIPAAPRKPAWLWAGAAIAAGILIALGCRTFVLGDSVPKTALAMGDQAYAAKRGEIRQVRLTDGSTVTLDTGSRVEVAMTATERKVRLAGGHARFDVAADRRPFRVEAGAGVVTAESPAVFDVGMNDGDQVLIQLISGRADIRPALRAAVLMVPAHAMVGGQNYAYSADEAQPASVPEEALSVDRSQWPTGWVDVHSITLESLIGEANRYAAQPIILDDPTTATLDATGRFKVVDTDGFVRKIADLFQLKIERRADGIHLSPR